MPELRSYAAKQQVLSRCVDQEQKVQRALGRIE